MSSMARDPSRTRAWWRGQKTVNMETIVRLRWTVGKVQYGIFYAYHFG
jgi:hypothetical protein